MKACRGAGFNEIPVNFVSMTGLLYKPQLHKLGRLLKRVGGYFPLTWAGLFLSLGLVAAVYHKGLGELDLVALAAGIALTLVLLLSILSVIAATLFLRRRISEQSHESFLELVSGRQVLSGYSIPFWTYVPFIRIGWEVEEFSSRVALLPQASRLREALNCGRRGLREQLTRRFTVSDTLGLSSLSWSVRRGGRIRVLPDLGCLDQPQILLSLISGEDISDPRGDPNGDRVDMRQYQKGDPMKFILWKVYSRSGKVMVRVPERALAARPRACCYLLAGPDDEASAALARALLERHMLGQEWRFGADGKAEHAHRLSDALDLIALSGNREQSSVTGLQSFLARAEKDGYGFCLVLAPPANKEFSESVYQCLGRSALRSEVWIGIDAPERERSSWLKPLQFIQSKGLSPRDLHATWGAKATLVERNSGRVLARSQGAPR